MNSARHIIGPARTIFDQYIRLSVAAHFAGEVVAGRMPARAYVGFLARLQHFLSKMRANKYVTTQGSTKINLYVPAFPSPAFYKACSKVMYTGGKQPCISVLLSVTSACRFRCAHCYQRLDRGHDVPIEHLVEVVRTLDRMGVAFFNIEGGDPFLVYDRLRAVCAAVTTGEIWVNSTGDGITRERLADLRACGLRGIMFSLHAPDRDGLNRFMGRDDAWTLLEHGVACCHAEGIDVAFNTCQLRPAFHDGSFGKLMDVARDFGATIIQLIKPKPSGAWLGQDLEQFTDDDLAHVARIVHMYNNETAYRDHPFIAAQILDEASDAFGCTAGGTDRFYVNAKGDVQPCEFLNISFGNILDEPFEEIYARMRAVFDVPGDRWLCEACAHDVHALHTTSGARTLPLSPELTAQLVAGWDRGSSADFYQQVETRYRPKKEGVS